jgi:hypothetical protein
MEPKPNKYKRTIRFYGDKNIGRILEAIFYSASVRIKKKLTALLSPIKCKSWVVCWSYVWGGLCLRIMTYSRAVQAHHTHPRSFLLDVSHLLLELKLCQDRGTWLALIWNPAASLKCKLGLVGVKSKGVILRAHCKGFMFMPTSHKSG